MTGAAGAMLYMYGIVGSDAPEPADLAGVEGGAVRLLRAGPVAAIVSEVPAAAYAEAVLDERLTELAWVGERGVEHERVLTWFVDRGSVVPLAPFSLHADEARARQRLQELAEWAAAALRRLEGRREWGVRVWRSAAAAENLGALSAPIRALDAELAAAAPGRRYLLQKKRAGAVAEELRAASAEVARQVWEPLEAAAEAAVRLALAAPPREAERVLILHAAFLVADTDFEAFQARVGQAAARFGALGFQCEFTGPWPPYHFVER